MGTRGDGGGVGMADPLDFSPIGDVTLGDSIRPLIKCVNRVRCTELTCFYLASASNKLRQPEEANSERKQFL